MDCIFCKIVNGEIPNYTIYEDEKYLAFLDIYPAAKGHLVVIPKEHFKYVWDVENIGEYFEVVRKIAKNMQAKSGQDVVYSFIHGEGVPHAHVHLFPKEGEKFSNAIHTMMQEDSKLKEDEASELVEKYKM